MKHWKLIVGILIVLFSLTGLAAKATGIALFFMAIGIALIAWQFIGRHPAAKKKDIQIKPKAENPKSSISKAANTAVANDKEEVSKATPVKLSEATPVKLSVATPAKLSEAVPEEDSWKKVSVPEVIDGERIAYHYDYEKIYIPDGCVIDYNKVLPGEKVQLIREPDNPYDKKAVKVVTADGLWLGYLFKGTKQDMVHDFQNRNLPILSMVSFSDSESKVIKIFLGFYRTNRRAEKATKIFKLTGNRNTDMQEALNICSENDEVTYDYDYDKEKYIASSGEEIGYFPKSANDLLEAEPSAYISKIEIDDDLNYTVFVAVEEN